MPLALRAVHWILSLALAAYLERGLAESSAYVAGSSASGELVPGLSDIDLVVILGGTEETAELDGMRVHERWQRFRHRFPRLANGFNLAVYGQLDLDDEDGGTCLTYGLGGDRPQNPAHLAGYLRPGRPADELYRRIHPGIYGPGRTWKRVSGIPRTRSGSVESAAYRRLAAWLELQWWWRLSFELCTVAEPALASYLAFKLVAEPARIWLWLAHDERVGSRREAIRRARSRLPDEAPILDRAAARYEALPHASAPPRAETLAWLLRIGTRIARLIDAEAAEHGVTLVELREGRRAQVSLAPGAEGVLRHLRSTTGGAQVLPLADWRARAMPLLAEDTLAIVPADPVDPEVVGLLSRSAVAGLQPALRAPHLLVLPNDPASDRVLLRSVQCAASDPVSFALLEDRRTATFPEVPGWSALDCARRAASEHRAWLEAWRAGGPQDERGLDLLFTAARAALFVESIEDGSPALPLDVSATVAGLGERHPAARSTAEEAAGALRERHAGGVRPPARVIEALRAAVEALPAYVHDA